MLAPTVAVASRVGGQAGGRFADRRVLVVGEAGAVDGVVVGVAGVVGDPVIAAGPRGGGVEVLRGELAVGGDRGRGGGQGRQLLLPEQSVPFIEVEGDRAGAGRVDQAGEGGDVGDVGADGRGGGGVGGEAEGSLVDRRVLVVGEAGAVDGVVVGVAGGSGRSSDSCRPPRWWCRSSARVNLAVGGDRGREWRYTGSSASGPEQSVPL